MSTTLTTANIKVNYQGQIRRLTLENQPNMYHTLMEQIFALYQLNEEAYPLCSIQYYDEDKDLISVLSDNELLTAIKVQTEVMGQSTLNLIFNAPSTDSIATESSVELEESNEVAQEIRALENLRIAEPSAPELSSSDSSDEDGTYSSDLSSSDSDVESELENLKKRKRLLKVQFKTDIKLRRMQFKQDMKSLKDEMRQKCQERCGEEYDNLMDLKKIRKQKERELRDELKECHKAGKFLQKMEKKKKKEAFKRCGRASKSVFFDIRQNSWPSHLTNLIIDAESMLVSTKAMNRLTKSEEFTRAACKILAKILTKFHYSMKDKPLQRTQLLFNDQKLASLVEEILKQNSSLYPQSTIQVISAKPAKSGGIEELVPTLVRELTANDAVQSTLIVTDNKNVLKSLKSTEAICVSSKPMIKYMFSTIDVEVQGKYRFKFFAWVNQECARLGVSPAKCK